MPRVAETILAGKQADGLRSLHRKAYDQFLDDLERRGCGAMEYRMAGDLPVSRLCVRHLRDNMRVVVMFEGDTAWVVLIARHDNSDPGSDVYTVMYELLGTGVPGARRTKPSCCGDDGLPPDLPEDLIAEIIDAARDRSRRR
ncbi:hypothetical protein [Longispora albida]|uniref:hypothetical protein n=1 Tax=Longispora albida TaxID=203523 RepID=UPI0003725E9A|nr:hypothetical protein [Longispora albida]